MSEQATSESKPTAVVIGGGIAGLCAAYDLHRSGWDVTVHEASERWGGKVFTSEVGSRLVDSGPDAFLARVDDAQELCTELGLTDQLVSPVSPVPAYIFRDNKLHALPANTFLGVPTSLEALEQSSLISPEGIANASQDMSLPATTIEPDISVGEVCRARLGDEITERLIDPLLGGINASDIDRLSLAAAAPKIAAALSNEPSLSRGLGAVVEAATKSASADKPQPVFYGLSGGVATIIDRLVAELPPSGLRTNSPVNSLAEATTSSGQVPDAVLVATPAFAAAEVVAETHPVASNELASINYASVSQVTVTIPAEEVDPVLDASGILFPRVDGRLMTACTWLSTKWLHHHRADEVLVRMTSGRYGDDRANELSDDELTSALLGELSSVVSISAPPSAVRVQRWPRSFPQYEPGHLDLVDRARLALSGTATPKVLLAGAAYDGIGLPACIRSGRTAAANLVDLRPL